jgi:Tfp pilus assembly protein PilN
LKDLNLIPKSYLQVKKEKIKKAYLSFVILIIGFLFAIGYIIPTVYEFNLKKVNNTLQGQVFQSSGYVATENKLNSLKQAVEVREQEGKNLSLIQNDYLKIQNIIEKATPDRLFIKSMTSVCNNNIAINITGTAENENIVASFVRNMQDEGYFKNIKITSILNNKESITFNIIIEGLSQNAFLSYKNWNDNYSISYPQNWVISKEKDSDTVITAPASGSLTPASIEILFSQNSNSLDASYNNRLTELRSKLTNFEKLSSSKTRISDVEAYKYIYCSQVGNETVKYSEICVAKNGMLFTVTYKDNYLEFESKERTIDRVLKSFNIG